ncbi:MAG TPA: hypothetical protein VK465_18450 [Fibrobacteria bacterium]|nr:hypothetical protein [Fibrobacteria bacterium]
MRKTLVMAWALLFPCQAIGGASLFEKSEPSLPTEKVVLYSVTGGLFTGVTLGAIGLSWREHEYFAGHYSNAIVGFAIGSVLGAYVCHPSKKALNPTLENIIIPMAQAYYRRHAIHF